MQVFKTFWQIALRKLPSTLIYFTVFMVITVAMTLSSDKNPTNTFEASTVDICIIDEDKSTASRALTDYLSSIHKRKEFADTSDEALQDHLFYHTVGYVLTIEKGFEKSLASEESANAGQNTQIFDTRLKTAKRRDSADGYFVDRQIDAYVRQLSLYLTSGLTIEDACSHLTENLEQLPEVTSLHFGDAETDTDNSLFYFFQYLPYVFLMMLLDGLSPVLMIFHQKTVDRRIACSSIPSGKHSSILAICCVIYSAAVWLAFMLLGLVMFGPRQMFDHNVLLCITNSLVYMVIAVMITLLMGIFPMQSNTLNMFSNILGLGMSFLCGVFVPQMYLGDGVLRAARFLPTYWYIRINNMFMVTSDEVYSAHTYMTCLGIELLFAAAIFAVFLTSNRRYRHRE